jgi:hypothetical protein
VRTLAERSVDVKKIIALVAWAALSACLNAQITLGPTVGTFGVLAGSTVTSTGATAVTGNLGVWPGTAITGITGIAPGGSGTVSGTIYSSDPAGVAKQAQSELTAAYNAVAGAASTATPTEDVGGQTLPPGVYTAGSSLEITGNVTLDAQNDPNAQFIFQIPSTLTANIGSSVTLIRGAVPANVFGNSGFVVGERTPSRAACDNFGNAGS